MADFMSSEQLVGRDGTESGNWDIIGGMDQITVVRIDDTHITEEQVNSAETCYEVECRIPAEDDEEDNVFVIEYSNPEEEGESYQFAMSVDRSLPAKKPISKQPGVREHARTPLSAMSKPRHQMKQKRKPVMKEEEKKVVRIEDSKHMVGREDYSNVGAMDQSKTLKCPLCPLPGKFFRRASGLAVHLKHVHHKETNKTYFCTTCQQAVRSQIELDAHTRRHAMKEAVFTCQLCTSEKMTGYRGTKPGLKSHLKAEHPGVIPHCDICNRGFKTLDTYLADQFRHVGVSPYYCAECQIYEMTERGLLLHMKNDAKKKKKPLQTCEDNSSTDDSDF